MHKVSNQFYRSREKGEIKISDIKSFAASKLGTVFLAHPMHKHFIKIQDSSEGGGKVDYE